jgi:hypothetical protein
MPAPGLLYYASLLRNDKSIPWPCSMTLEIIELHSLYEICRISEPRYDQRGTH